MPQGIFKPVEFQMQWFHPEPTQNQINTLVRVKFLPPFN